MHCRLLETILIRKSVTGLPYQQFKPWISKLRFSQITVNWSLQKMDPEALMYRQAAIHCSRVYLHVSDVEMPSERVQTTWIPVQLICRSLSKYSLTTIQRPLLLRPRKTRVRKHQMDLFPTMRKAWQHRLETSLHPNNRRSGNRRKIRPNNLYLNKIL